MSGNYRLSEILSHYKKVLPVIRTMDLMDKMNK